MKNSTILFYSIAGCISTFLIFVFSLEYYSSIYTWLYLFISIVWFANALVAAIAITIRAELNLHSANLEKLSLEKLRSEAFSKLASLKDSPEMKKWREDVVPSIYYTGGYDPFGETN